MEHSGDRVPTTQRRLMLRYFAALGVLAILLLLGQALTQWTLGDMRTDARRVHLATEQRALVAHLAETAASLATAPVDDRRLQREQFQQTLARWAEVHAALRDGDTRLDLPRLNSLAVQTQLASVEPSYEAIRAASRRLLDAVTRETADTPVLAQAAEDLRREARAYSALMDAVANQYDAEATDRVLYLQRVEFLLTLTVLFALGLLLFFVFRPTARRVQDMLYEVLDANEALQAANEALVEARERAQAADRAKGEFLATMSHEIRTPMNGVIGMTSLLEGTPLSDQQREFVETIRNSGNTLLALINDILDFSKIEAGRIELDEHAFMLREVVEEAVDLVATRAAEKRLELIYDIDPDVPRAVIADGTRLRQILVNLLSNAVKFTETGEVVLLVRVAEQADDEERVLFQFSVRDTGIGIHAEKANRLFRPFSQVDASTTRKYGGTGLGLSICKRLAELMGGRIWVESRIGFGSTFHFTICAEALPDLDPTGGQVQAFEGRRVLIVDDNTTNRRVLSLQVERWGMRPMEFEDGPSALKWLEVTSGVDLALLDMQMPEMDGLELAREIRHRRPQLPCIILSSIGYRLNDPSITASLIKPVKQDYLQNVLLRALHAPDAEALADLLPEADERPPLRILIAEDHSVNQKVALQMLERLGYRADLAANGREAVDALQRQVYDVILMDIQMPVMDGVEATRAIRAQFPAERQPYIIAVTANAMSGDREYFLSEGLDAYLSKPIRLEGLEDALRAGYAKRYSDGDWSPPPAAADGETGEAEEARLHREAAARVYLGLRTRLTELVGEDDPEFAREVLDSYLKGAPALLRELHDGYLKRDGVQVRKAAQTLRSSSRMIGAATLDAACIRLEEDAHNDFWVHAPDLISQIERVIAEIQAAFREEAGTYELAPGWA